MTIFSRRRFSDESDMAEAFLRLCLVQAKKDVTRYYVGVKILLHLPSVISLSQRLYIFAARNRDHIL